MDGINDQVHIERLASMYEIHGIIRPTRCTYAVDEDKILGDVLWDDH